MTDSREFASIYSSLGSGVRENQAADEASHAALNESLNRREAGIQQAQKASGSNLSEAHTALQSTQTAMNSGRSLLETIGLLEEDIVTVQQPINDSLPASRRLEQATQDAGDALLVLRLSQEKLVKLRLQDEQRRRVQRRIVSVVLGLVAVVCLIFFFSANSQIALIDQTATAEIATGSNLTAIGTVLNPNQTSGTESQLAHEGEIRRTPTSINDVQESFLSSNSNIVADSTNTTTFQTPSVRLNGVVSTAHLNVRLGPGPEYDNFQVISNGDLVVIVGRSGDSTWLQIEQPTDGWVSGTYINLEGDTSQLPITFREIGDWGTAKAPTGIRARATTVLRLRGGPGDSYRQLSDPDTLKEGQTVDVVGRDSSGEWLQVNIGNRSAWIRAGYAALDGSGDIPIVATG